MRVELEVFKQLINAIGGGEAGDKTIVRSKEQADHSINYLIAVALLDGDVQPEQFRPERVRSEEVQDLLRRVWTRRSDEFTHMYPSALPVRISVVMKDRYVYTKEKRDYEGFATRPMSLDRAQEKFERLTSRFADEHLRREIASAVDKLETTKVSELTNLLGRVRVPA